MTKKNSISLRLIAIVSAIVTTLVAVAVILSKCEGTAIVAEKNKTVKVTPAVVSSIQSIGQWEFLTINDEEYVDTIRKGFFSDDGLARIYYGTLRIGINLDQVSDHSFRIEHDSILVVTLPKACLLDRQFIDEARTRPFYEQGKWGPDARDALFRRAEKKMLSRCLTPSSLQRAEGNARKEVSHLLHLMGYKNVRILFD